MSKEQKTNYKLINALTKARKSEIEDLELKARYWKAQYEIKQYSIENRRLRDSPEYQALMKEVEEFEKSSETAGESSLETQEEEVSNA